MIYIISSGGPLAQKCAGRIVSTLNAEFEPHLNHFAAIDFGVTKLPPQLLLVDSVILISDDNDSLDWLLRLPIQQRCLGLFIGFQFESKNSILPNLLVLHSGGLFDARDDIASEYRRIIELEPALASEYEIPSTYDPSRSFDDCRFDLLFLSGISYARTLVHREYKLDYER